jgi:hypothetical protein
MEKNMHSKDFEQFLKQNANQYRMYPSERVWKGIYNHLHNRRRWLWFGAAMLALTISAVTWMMLTTPAPKTPASFNPELQTGSLSSAMRNKTETVHSPMIPAPVKNTAAITVSEIPFLLGYSSAEAVASRIPDVTENTTTTEIVAEEATVVKKSLDVTPAAAEKFVTKAEEPPVPQFSSTDIRDNEPGDLNKTTGSQSVAIKTPEIPGADNYPLTIESVLNYYKASLNKKLTFQAYFVPTISYRKLSENKAILNAAAASNAALNVALINDINNVVTHKPDLGLELGLTARYPLTKNMHLRGGLQFNISRYDIKAFNYNGEVATIALNQGSQVNAIYTWTNYRTFSGFSSNWLKNYYFSVSAPIGAEYRFGGNKNKKASYGIAGTIQPTYIIQDRAYLISSDYKNYTQIPWLIRRWNANTSFETFVSYKSGHLRWQVGSQVRYQLFSSFSNKYPVKENLFDFGLKVGISLND